MIDFGFDLAGKREPRLVRGIVLSSLGAILEAAPLLVAFAVLDRVFAGEVSSIPLGLLTAVLVGLLVISFAFRSVGSIDNFVATYRLVAATRLRLADHLRRLPMGFFQGRRMGELASVLTDEFALYTEVATHAWGMTVANIALPVALAGVLALADWRLALVALLPVPLAIAALPWSFSRINAASDRLSQHRSALVADLVEFVDGLPTLTAFQATQPFRERIAERSAALSRQQMRAELAPAPTVLGFGLLVHAGFALVLLGGALFMEPLGIAPARFVLVALLTAHFTRTLAELVIFLSAARFAARTLQRTRKLFAEAVQPEGLEAVEGRAEVAFENVRFSYGQVSALNSLTLGFPEGSVTALVGPSGSGKSTLAKLLLRLWDIDAGRIELGGTELSALRLSEVHRHVASIFQDVVLFEESVMDNIRLSHPTASLDAVVAAAKAAGAHTFIENLPEGYDTVLGPGGGRLSGGERQRVAIARALLKNAPILILDEATASVDPDQEHEIQRAIANLMRGRTVVVIAHRLWTVRDVDQIFVLDKGSIVERGTHEELFDAEGLYRRLWDAQQASSNWRLGGSAR
ncbi:MAG: ABC transporter ATP-binding protein [Myxococcota bacterium]